MRAFSVGISRITIILYRKNRALSIQKIENFSENLYFFLFLYIFVYIVSIRLKITKKGMEINMVRGVQKRLVEVKLRDSKLYESACLVLKTETAGNITGERDLLDEANRIIASLDVSGNAPKKIFSVGKITVGALLVLSGILIGFALGVLV